MSFSLLQTSGKLSTRLVVNFPRQKCVCDENKLPKRGPYPSLTLVLRWPGGPCGVGGFNYLQVCETGYLTRPWAVGPANFWLKPFLAQVGSTWSRTRTLTHMRTLMRKHKRMRRRRDAGMAGCIIHWSFAVQGSSKEPSLSLPLRVPPSGREHSTFFERCHADRSHLI